MGTKSKKPPAAKSLRVNSLEQALNAKAFGKHKGKTFRQVVAEDLAWLHWLYRRKRQEGDLPGSPCDLNIMLLCKHYPLGVGDKAEQELAARPDVYEVHVDDGPTEVTLASDTMLRDQRRTEAEAIWNHADLDGAVDDVGSWAWDGDGCSRYFVYDNDNTGNTHTFAIRFQPGKAEAALVTADGVELKPKNKSPGPG